MQLRRKYFDSVLYLVQSAMNLNIPSNVHWLIDKEVRTVIFNHHYAAPGLFLIITMPHG
jgi:hypothetical protein